MGVAHAYLVVNEEVTSNWADVLPLNDLLAAVPATLHAVLRPRPAAAFLVELTMLERYRSPDCRHPLTWWASCVLLSTPNSSVSQGDVRRQHDGAVNGSRAYQPPPGTVSAVGDSCAPLNDRP